MNRRDLLKTAAAAATVAALPRTLYAQDTGTPATGSFPELAITITDDGFDFPDDLTAGRYAVAVTNDGTTPSH